MNDSWIGWWAYRPHTKAHLVETEITDRLVMRCGRQMKLSLHDQPLVFQQTPFSNIERCEQCEGRIVAD